MTFGRSHLAQTLAYQGWYFGWTLLHWRAALFPGLKDVYADEKPSRIDP
jgi:hypothetical protein